MADAVNCVRRQSGRSLEPCRDGRANMARWTPTLTIKQLENSVGNGQRGRPAVFHGASNMGRFWSPQRPESTAATTRTISPDVRPLKERTPFRSGCVRYFSTGRLRRPACPVRQRKNRIERRPCWSRSRKPIDPEIPAAMVKKSNPRPTTFASRLADLDPAWPEIAGWSSSLVPGRSKGPGPWS